MERYSEYKDSGVKWLGKIPSHWELRKMKYTFDERSQKGFPNEPLLAATQNHGVILKSQYENRTVEAVKSLDTLKLVEIGDFVISLRSFQGGLEYAHNRGIISPAYTILTPTHIKASYFKHLSKSDIFISLLKSSVTGIREGQNIDYNKLKESLLPIPPEEEQKAMGCYLDAATSKIDKAIDMQQKMIDLLNERKQIIIQNAVTKGLDANVEMKDSGVEWSPQIPKKWNVRRLRFLCDFQTGDKDTINRVANGKYPFFVRSPQIERINSYTFDGEAILMAGDGVGAGKVFHYYKGKFDYHQRVYNLHNFRAVDGKYLFYYLKQNFKYIIERAEAKSTVDSVRIIMLKDFMACFPSIKEQQAIVAYLDKEMLNFDSAITNCQRQIALLQERKQIIINEVVTGKVKVS